MSSPSMLEVVRVVVAVIVSHLPSPPSSFHIVLTILIASLLLSSMQVLVMVGLGQFTGSGGVVNSYDTGAGMVTMVLSLSLLWVLQVVVASSG